MPQSKARYGLINRHTLSVVLINVAAIMERADEGLLPAVYSEVGAAFNASPSELGWLTFIRALTQALCSPIAGFLSIHYDRAQVVGFGTVFWAFSTAGVGMSQTYWQCAIWRAINGVGLAIVVPSIQSFVADSCQVDSRGFAFGVLSLTGTAGSIIGGMAATILAGQGSILGLPGWRFAFLGMAVLSVILGWLINVYVIDPREVISERKASAESLPRQLSRKDAPVFSVKESFALTKSVLSIPTFQIIVLQGLVGSVPWQAMVFFTMWLQLVGFSHSDAAILIGLFSTGCALGSFFGGWLGDRAAKSMPDKGRIMVAQLSAFLGVPFSYILLVLLPPTPSSHFWVIYAATFFIGGLTISWCASSTNNPIFAEIVPSNLRTTVYAFDRAFEGTIAALAAPAVGILAESLFGYKSDIVAPVGGSPHEAQALAKGLFSLMALPFSLCSICYGLLYHVYRKDRDNMLRHAKM